jgi:membrane protein
MAANATTANVWSFSEIKRLLTKTYNEWSEDQAPRLGAALAYYTVLSLAPLLILLLAVAGLVFGDEAARGQLFGELNNMVGPDGAKAIQEMVQNASKPASGILASIIGFLTLIFGASSVAGELKNALNIIWDQPESSGGVKEMVKQRSSALVVVLGCGFLLLVSLVVSSSIAAAGSFVANSLPIPEAVMLILNTLLAIAVITGVFAVLFKYLPDVDLQWRDVLLGALFTSVLFAIGKLLIGLYLGKASFGSTYGAAGSLVIVLVWVYYSSQIFFFGAEFTQVYASEHGSDPHKRRQGAPQAVPKVSPTVISRSNYPTTVAAGNNQESGGIMGALVGGALAMTKAVRSFRK